VLKQDLLVVMPDSSMSVEKSGCALIKLRINDVSKNHQRQQFHVTVSPDTGAAPLLNDVSADESHNIEVKSKRTKRTRDSVPAVPSGSGQLLYSAPAATQYAGTNNNTNNNNRNGIHSQQYTTPASQHGNLGLPSIASQQQQQQHQHNQAALQDDSQLLLLNGAQCHGTRSGGMNASTAASTKASGQFVCKISEL
jgi:hypothetical protein